ncbi:MAG: ATP-binding protein, partial [Marinilabiliales bacterium]|nr:ATP-binding protein [Marinilabiliales bacterium]
HVHQGILLVLRDITELIDTVKERNYAASKLDAVIHAMPDTLFIFNHEGILTDFFAHNEDKMFLNREEIIGASLYHLFDKEEAEILMETLEQCLNSNKLITHQYAMNFPGEIRHYESRVSRLDDAHVLAIIRDISESVDMRYDLLYQSGFREILMNLASGFIHVQEDSADRVIFDSLRQVGKYTDIETCSLFRYYDNMTTIVMTHEWHMTNPDYAGTLPPVYYDVIPEWAASHQKGELMKIQNLSESLSANKLLATMVPEGSGTVLTIPMISQKNCLGFLFLHCLHSKRSWSDSEISSLKIFTGMLANLLEKITIEKSLVEARIKAEAGNRMKTAFMNNISHEIRTPLNGIIGFGEIIANNTLSNEEKNRFLSVVQESSERLISTIDDYLDISLLATGNLEPNSRVIDLPLLLEEVTAEFRDACSRKDLDIHTMVSPQITRTKLHSDPDLIRKVMGHLISNAVKFTHKGYIRILLEENNGTFSIIVEDTGIGISESAQQIIFDSFTQEDFSASRLYEGSGLGLAIVKGIVTLLQGSISLTSTRGQGSKFTICFSDLKGYDLHKI